jgi:hypothetical protein
MANNKIVWFLVGNPLRIASSRIHGLNVHNKLVDKGYNSFLSYIPNHIEEKIPIQLKKINNNSFPLIGGDIIVLQKIKSHLNYPLLADLKKKGIKIVFIDCDLPISQMVAGIADVTICTSLALCSIYKNEGFNALYIEDCPEFYWEELKNSTNDLNLKCYWFGDGSDEKWKEVSFLREIIKKNSIHLNKSNWELITISNHSESNIIWKYENFFQHLTNADAIVLPIFNKDESTLVKSANRLIQSMAISKPVICSPIPSYLKVIKNWENGVICENELEWVNAFNILEDSTLRREIGQNAYKTSLQYHLDNTIEKWVLSLGLNEQFLMVDKKSYVKEKSRIEKYFYHRLLSQNISYWDKNPRDIVSFMIYIIKRLKNLISKLRLT